METNKKSMMDFIVLVSEYKTSDSLETVKYLRSLGFSLPEAVYLKNHLSSLIEIIQAQLNRIL